MPVMFLPFEMTFTAPWSTARVALPDWQEVTWQHVTQAPVTNLASPAAGRSWQAFQVIWRPRDSTPELVDEGATAAAVVVVGAGISETSPAGAKPLPDDEDGRP